MDRADDLSPIRQRVCCVSARERLRELGGVASYRTLVQYSTRRDLERAVAAGDVVRVGRGRYALPEAEVASVAAHALHGVLSHASAALAWGWALKEVPDRPHVTVPVKRKVPTSARAGIHLHRGDLSGDQVRDGRTSAAFTLEQCLRTMPFPDALALADSALREGVMPETVRSLARDARGPGSPKIRAVAAAANGLAANPFESVLRAIAMEVAGLHVRPQVWIGQVRPDLVDEELRIVLEADSFAWHGSRSALRRDAERYNNLTVAGWLVLRFSWEEVMLRPLHVRSTLISAVDLAHRRR